MTMEMIVTDENNGQYIEIVSFPALPLDKKEFVSKNINHFITPTTAKVSLSIVKIGLTESIPYWYISCNGKFFFKNGELQ